MKNEPAYPIVGLEFKGECILAPKTGLTKREYFAGLAMQGALGGESGSHLRIETLARDSVAYADALLEALNESK